MIATNAYYLISPFNLILFLFPISKITWAVFLIIALKIACNSLISFYVFQKRYQSPLSSLALSLSYSLSGFVVANYFNLIWLDSLILLPLLIYNIDLFLAGKKQYLILLICLSWLFNFYSGYMILLFASLYFLSQLIVKEKANWLKFCGAYLSNFLLATLLSAFVLIPTFFELLQGKANSIPFNWSIQFNPLELLAKLTPASYNYQEMSDGLPNIYLTNILLFACCAYFLSQKKLKEKIVNGIMLIFLIASLFFTPLILLWHLGQFPVWYPGRFSFIFIFYCLLLAQDYFKEETELSWPRKLILGLLAVGLVAYWLINQNNFSFMDETTIILACLFIIASLLFYFFIFANYRIWKVYLYSIVFLSVICNFCLSLNNLSFQSSANYLNFTQKISQALPKNQTGRSEKTFERSDNDDFSSNYAGISTFNSISNAKISNFLSNLGFIHNSNSVTNNGSSPIVDSFLGIKNYLYLNNLPIQTKDDNKLVFENLNHRVDINNYQAVKNYDRLSLVKNREAMNLLFLTDSAPKKLNFIPGSPAFNQNLLAKTYLKTNSSLLLERRLTKPKLINAKYSKLDQEYLPINKNKNAFVSYHLKLKGDYYLELSSNINDDTSEIWINNHLINLNIRDSQAYLLNLVNNKIKTDVKLVFKLKQNNLNQAFMHLFKFQRSKFIQLTKTLNQNQPKITQTSALSFKTSEFTLKKEQMLASSIPYNANWLIFDQGHLIKSQLYLNTFLGTKLPAGKHQLTLIYFPKIFLLACLISLLTLAFYHVLASRRKRYSCIKIK